MARKKLISLKKPPARKRRVNTTLGPEYEASSASIAVKEAPQGGSAVIDVPVTPVTSKAPRLRLNMTSYRYTTLLLGHATPSLRLNGPKNGPKQ